MRVTYMPLLAIFCAALGTSVFAEDKLDVVRLNEVKWAPCDPKAAQPDPCQIQYFHGDPEKGPNHSYFRVPKGHLFPAHWHTGTTHLLVIKGVFMVGAENDSKGTALRPGDFAYEPAKWVHWGKCVETDCVVYLYVDGPDSYIDVKERRP